MGYMLMYTAVGDYSNMSDGLMLVYVPPITQAGRSIVSIGGAQDHMY